MANYIICTRNAKGSGADAHFGDEPGSASFLVVPDDATDFSPKDKVNNEKTWLTKLLANRSLKDVLIYVHGYDMDRANTLARHKVLKQGLQQQGWEGEVITFAWPSGTKPLLYWEDRFDALDVAAELVRRCIRLLDDQVKTGCDMDVHVIAHSTGALIVRESFRVAQSAFFKGDAAWATGQMIFIAGDVSSDSMEGEMSDQLYRHCGRLTNYFSNHDSILAVSGAKRLGFANRVGRVGLPKGSPEKAIDVNCSAYYTAHKNELEQKVVHAFLPHSWHFWSERFMQDLVYTLKGELDRNVIPTRSVDDKGEFWLKE